MKKTIICPSQQTTTKTIYTEIYITDKTDLVKIYFINTNGPSSRNDFGIENILLSVVDKYQNDAISTSELMTNQDGIIDVTRTLGTYKIHFR